MADSKTFTLKISQGLAMPFFYNQPNIGFVHENKITHQSEIVSRLLEDLGQKWELVVYASTQILDIVETIKKKFEP